MATTTTSADCVTSSTTTSFLEYVSALENRLATRSDDLEEKHMEAAIDAQLIDTSQQSNSNPLLLSTPQPQPGSTGPTTSTHPPLFDDYTNPNAVPNCLSPYVPAQAVRIAALPRFAKLEASDVLLDLGCGDGRVCVAMSKLTGCRAVGVDLSPLCIRLATDLAWEEQGDGVDCTFFQADATLDPTQLLHEDSPLHVLRSATCVFLFTYPTLLQALVPLLEHLTTHCNTRRVVTLTYHLDDRIATVVDTCDSLDMRLYSRIQRGSVS